MTVEPKIMMFNKASEWTYCDWLSCNARHILNQIHKKVVVWVYARDMTDEEKQQYPEYKTTGGYLKRLNEDEINRSRQEWWDKLSQRDKDIIFAIPNFDAEIFKECTGIEVRNKNNVLHD